MADGSGLAAVGFSLAASLSWGTSDFSGGMAAKRAPLIVVMALSYSIGLTLVIVLALITAEPLSLVADLAWAIAAGLSGTVGLTALYRALAIGRMGVVAPVTAVVGTVFPVGFTMITEGLPGLLQLVGFALGLIAVWFVARPADSDVAQDDTPSGLGLAILAGMGFSVFGIFLDRVSSDALYWPLAASRLASLIVMGTLVLTQGLSLRPGRAAIPVIALAGILDVGGNAFFLLAIQAGRLDVASVLTSLYPAVTVLLARVILSERMSRVQTFGVVGALAAIVLIAV
jgi:drug/metabolite transporter (DMT)-like permease